MHPIIETHAHIYDKQFDEDRDLMLKTAFDTGVKQIWMPNCNHETIQGMMALEQQYPEQCFAMMGLHPCYVDEKYSVELDIIKTWLEKRKFIMIGEIGIDYYWDLSFQKEQEMAFLEQLALAKKYNLPICIHSRNSKDNQMNAIQRSCELIKEFGWKDLRGVFHCFSGNLEDAKRVISLNFKLGIGGVSTFKNGGLDQFLAQIDLENIILETDAPYLAPVPHRGKRNDVVYINLVAQKLAQIYDVEEEIIRRKTTENAMELIGN